MTEREKRGRWPAGISRRTVRRKGKWRRSRRKEKVEKKRKKVVLVVVVVDGGGEEDRGS